MGGPDRRTKGYRQLMHLHENPKGSGEKISNAGQPCKMMRTLSPSLRPERSNSCPHSARDGLLRSARNDDFVVPAKAGTHSHRERLWCEQVVAAEQATKACGYGSPLSRGRRVACSPYNTQRFALAC